MRPAAFGRLCVETPHLIQTFVIFAPAAFGRLCVETFGATYKPSDVFPAAFGRLCVETCDAPKPVKSLKPAAFRRLCVETGGKVKSCRRLFASRLQAAIYQYNSEISHNKGRLKTLSIGFQTTFFSHQHKPDTLE